MQKHGKQIKDDRRDEALRREGASKEKAARIANPTASEAGRRGGRAANDEDMTRDELYEWSREIGISVRSKFTKQKVVAALRNH